MAPKNYWASPTDSGCYDICVYTGYGELVLRAVLPSLEILDMLSGALPDGEYLLSITKDGECHKSSWRLCA